MTTHQKVRAINRLQSMYNLRAEVDKMYNAQTDASEENKPVAWVMLEGWANPILNAMDIRTVYPENYSSVCAAQGKAMPFLERSIAEGYPTHLCGYARASVGYSAAMIDLQGEIPPHAPAGGMAKPDLLVGSGEVCDARFKWFQSLGRYFNVPVWVLESPSPGLRESLEEEDHENNVKFLVNELHQFVEFLENLLQRKMNWDRLDFTSKGTNEINRLRWEINELRKAKPCPMHTRDFWSAMSAALYRGAADPTVIIQGFQKMYDEVKYRVDNKISAINYPEKYRISFEGLPPWHSLGFLDTLAERGWNFVCENAYSPMRPINIDLGKYTDPIERYVRSRYRSQEQRIDIEYPAEEAVKIKQEIMETGVSSYLRLKDIRDRQCDGVFLHILLSCRAASSGLHLHQQRLKDILKVPSLLVEGDIIDTNLFNPADALRKAEIFEETMDHYKEVRKKSGMPW